MYCSNLSVISSQITCDVVKILPKGFPASPVISPAR
jgi:hypothetical protein